MFKKLITNKTLKRIILLGMACALVGTAFIMSLTMFVWAYGRRDTATFDEDAIIVLGAAVWGENVSGVLADRLRKAIEYHHQNPNALIVVAGGQGEGAITEAEAMRRFLVAHGVPDELIIKENRSTNTFENIKFAREILDELLGENYRVVIITNDFHAFRAVSMARRQGMSATRFSAPRPWSFMPRTFLRETAGVTRLWVAGH